MTWHVHLLGGLRVEKAGEPLRIAGRKAQNLFAFLILYPSTSHSREMLAEQLWPDLAPHRSRHNLSDLTYRLKRALGAGLFDLDTDSIALRADAPLWVDVWDFDRLIATGDPASLRQAVDRYAGDLLPEIYDDWILPRRVSLREKYLNALFRLGWVAEDQQQPATALDYYQRLAHADPLREEAHRGVMRSLARMGKLPAALDAYATLESILRDEMGIRPGADSQALADTLRSELELARIPTRSPPAFVGRMNERASLRAWLDLAQPQGSLSVILGEAGIGKTRLLQELDQAAGWRGWQVVWGHSDEFGLRPPYSPLRQALEAALPKPRLQQIAQLVQPVWLSIAGGLIPAAAEVLQSREPPPSPPDLARLATALRHILTSLRQIAPHLIILDDVQWADAGFWPLLDTLCDELPEASIRIVVSGRSDELRLQAAAWETLSKWERAGLPFMQLEGLNRDELREMASGVAQGEVEPAQIEQLHAASGGNPLLALELMQAGGPDQAVQKPSLTELMGRRIAALSNEARLALQAAAVLGYRFDYQVWQSVAGLRNMPRLAGELEQAGAIILEADGYRFTHDTLRAYVYSQLDLEARRDWHRRALTALQDYTPSDGLSMLYHAEQSGDRGSIARHALQAGQQTLAAFHYKSARSYFEQALESLAPDEIAARFDAALGLARALDVLAEREAQRETVEQITALADELNDNRRRAEAHWQRANLEWTTGQFEQAGAAAEAGLGMARRANEVKQQALLLEIAGRSARDLGEYARANERFTQAKACYAQLNDERGVAWIDGMLGLVAQRLGRLQEAIDYHTRAMNAQRQMGDPFNEMRAASGLAIAQWMVGDYVQARAIFERTLILSRQVDDRRMQEASLANLGALADILGDYVAAIDLKEQALALSRAVDNKMGVALGLSNLGITYYKIGKLESSLAAFDEAIAIDRATGRRQGEAYSLHGRGVTLFEMGRLAEARESLEAARAIRTELAERDVLIATEADLALVALASGDIERARAGLQAALDALQPDDRADLREHVHYTAHQVRMAQGLKDTAIGHARQAEAAMLELAGSLPPEARERFLRQDPLNRKVRAVVDSFAHKTPVRLVRAGVPLGRRLTDTDYIQVEWTLHAPGDDAVADAAMRRRFVLKRMLDESAAQGATPTDDDLARALGVSRRTVMRDMEALARFGVRHSTRRRRADR